MQLSVGVWSDPTECTSHLGLLDPRLPQPFRGHVPVEVRSEQERCHRYARRVDRGIARNRSEDLGRVPLPLVLLTLAEALDEIL